MKFQSSLLLAGLTAQGVYSSILAERQVCNANNCLRLVRGTDPNQRPTLASRQADCSSFMRVTVTPATVTATATVTASVTVTVSAAAKRDVELAARQVTASSSAVPTYATSVCLSSAAYSSACACVGITKSTITAIAPSTTVTVTATATATVVAGPIYPETVCGNPYICDLASACSTPNGCQGYCQPDADGVGRCSAQSAATACSSQSDKKCNVNADCKTQAGGLCINDCCGFKSCYYESNGAFCINTGSTKMIFRKKAVVVREDGEKMSQPVGPST